jgi:hypothetical protein
VDQAVFVGEARRISFGAIGDATISRRQSQTTNVEQTTWTFGQLEKIGETKDFDRQLVKRN